MSDLLPPTLAIAIATVKTPRPAEEGGSDRHLIGAALLEVEERASGEFLHRHGACTIPPGASEALLIDWLNQRLPQERILIGWQLADEIVPAAIEASEAAAPEDARRFIEALAALVTADAVDLADGDPIAGRTFADMCAEAHVPCWAISEDEVLAAWALGREVELTGLLTTNAVATWRGWAQSLRPDDPVLARFAQAVLAGWVVDHDGSEQCWTDEEGA